MKTNLFRTFALLAGLLAVIPGCRETSKQEASTQTSSKAAAQISYKNISYPLYRKNQLIVVYKKKPTPDIKEKVRGRIRNHIRDSLSKDSRLKGSQLKGFKFLNVNSLIQQPQQQIEPKICNDCDESIELWNGPGVEEFIEAATRQSGSGGVRVSGHGEDDNAFYFFNFIHQPSFGRDAKKIKENRSPFQTAATKLSAKPFSSLAASQIDATGKPKVIIAVLDSGIDPTLIDEAFLWKNPDEKPGKTDQDGNCYPGDILGWNFVQDTANPNDDGGKHGTRVSRYIIDQWADSAPNLVQIMSLKILDRGEGELFDFLCAIQYAKFNGAKIINASLGFYYYGEGLQSSLNAVLTENLQAAGILFFAAAGNQIDAADETATRNGINISDLRDLTQHHFYPAALSDEDNNIITVTTTMNDSVSPNQNRSDFHVDLGVDADYRRLIIRPDNFRYEFLDPLSPPEPGDYSSGSSYATAIAAGQVGAFLPPAHYLVSEKRKLMDSLETASNNGSSPGSRPIQQRSLLTGDIRKGRVMMKR